MIAIMKDVTKWYGEGKLVLDRVTFKIDKNEHILITGSAGSGKTTMAKLLGGMTKTDEGEIICAGKPGLMPSYDLGLDMLTVKEYICLPFAFANISVEDQEKRISALLRFFELEHKENTKIKLLSPFEIQCVRLIQALVCKPPFLIADEPACGLGQSAAVLFYDKLFEVVRRLGMGLVCFSDDRTAAYRFDSVLHIKDGKLLEVGR